MESPLGSPTSLGHGFGVTSLPPKRPDAQLPVINSSPRGRLARDTKIKRISPPKLGLPVRDASSVVGGGTKWTGKSRFNSSATSRPLVPASDRIAQEDKLAAWRARRKPSDEKVDITPDGGSGGRDGRQFTVANVGNNGRIYLKPSIRPANQRYPQPSFVFPMTPPGTAGLDNLADKASPPKMEGASDLNQSVWTPAPSTPATGRQTQFPGHARRPTGHRRALSDSTTRDESDQGGFKVVITKPGDEKRPKTMEDLGASHMPLLDVDIPNPRIGNLRFTMRGTPFFRGSSYAPTDEFPRSSNVSFLRSQNGTITPRGDVPSRRPSPKLVPHIRLPSADGERPASIPVGRLPAPYRSTYMSTHVMIEPAMFDSLTFQPACDDKAIVRYSNTSGAVTAATPPRLVAEITSPTFLDYELLSDFFLTYRSFLEPSDLLRMLVARLRWSLARDDEVGMVVRVRTFVAMRHWILNYFMDDFVVDYGLRTSFCTLLNDFVEELSQDARALKVQLKILAELKKCWRRVCAQFWDGPEFDASLDASAPIAPGGIAGHRNASLDPSFWEEEDKAPRLSGLFPPPRRHTARDESFYADVSKAGHIADAQYVERPSTPEQQRPADLSRQQTSPTSIVSMDIVSCSFPGKALRAVQSSTSHPLAAHPVPPSSIYTSAGAVATTPRALTGKRVRPVAAHKRNGSMTDSLREKDRAAARSSFDNGMEVPMSFPFAGNLVRGNFLPPGQPFVEVIPPGQNPDQRQTTVFHPAPDALGVKSAPSAMSSQGMKKLLSSVRRHLSNRGQPISPTQGSFLNISAMTPQGATTNRLPGTAIVPQARPRFNGARPPVRIDLLGAEIAEDFKKAVREDAAAEAERRELAYRLPAGINLESAIPGDLLEYSAAHMDTSIPLLSPSMASQSLPSHLRPLSDTGITTGSKSIVIVDDTLPFGLTMPLLPAMHGALPSMPNSVEAFGDHLVPNNADPTPPTTPPGQPLDTPRRSSYLLNHHAIRPSSCDSLPPFVPDLATLGFESPAANINRPSVDTSRQSEPGEDRVASMKSHLSSSVRMHRRGLSSRTNHSLNSILHRRANSLHSAWAKRSTIRSFDATTYSESASVFHEDDEDDLEALNPPPQPARMLRRRPGGDLRAANVGDLDALPLRKSRSLASLTTYSESVKSSFLRSPETQVSHNVVNVASSDFSPSNQQTFSLGAMAEAPAKREKAASLFSTHSSKPVMRPSFEAEAKKLAQIPDDDDDGGVESALAKLEGTYEKKSFKLSIEPTNAPLATLQRSATGIEHNPVTEEEKKEHRQLHVGDGEEAVMHHHQQRIPDESEDASSVREDVPTLKVPKTRPETGQRSFLSDNSGGSYSSVPLLERGLTDDGRSKATTVSEWRDRSILFGPDDPSPSPTPRAGSFFNSHQPSQDFTVAKMENGDRETDRAVVAPAASEHQSFLDDESDKSDNGTELSSELSDNPGPEETTPGPIFPARMSSMAARNMPVHPLATSATSRDSELPSPPMSLNQALRMSPEMAQIPQVHEHQIWSRKPLPPTPETTPTAPQHSDSARDDNGMGGRFGKSDSDLTKKYSVHLPFILAFDSETLAQQFTLIEKDALNEIDWKELIEMTWKNSANNDSRSWVDFLRNSDAHGVEVVIARFNIMVKWACSQIVLTQDIEERARCIIKFIHIAAHCRKYRNFATMSQIAIALTSQEVSRLSRTWAMVPPYDLQTLQDLESLVAPMRNFHNLRAEMEGGSDHGCIPFVGIYTHDLLFNAQRPSEIASSPTTAPLVNFERCRYAATIVKTLLRLLEASTLYHFQPVEGITERCLWMSALTDDQIRQHSQNLE
ncbi:RasGEF domain-containing protein [Plectosphaerella cucumerina]|uniref:RasGEF domain-containing protein n=1 Tax=Plectosphaerella cucumerina TaxID=40658 RepID=A0A8K0WXL4_9PEZI|nr:RasGEF domain-containing protein [Plectosphaerella cucumerina]